MSVSTKRDLHKGLVGVGLPDITPPTFKSASRPPSGGSQLEVWPTRHPVDSTSDADVAAKHGSDPSSKANVATELAWA
ncbi:hypothetical protein B296_00021365 [Ensete ventricosum]|uniref:Uncharacterized protein n=1 Tax=Ensete ventricosum TaxID=4639 RepID=A0A426YYJ8_ENSVE|nr:hypothetical protein B296_00021365 [Ensete ventricosum]